MQQTDFIISEFEVQSPVRTFWFYVKSDTVYFHMYLRKFSHSHIGSVVPGFY